MLQKEIECSYDETLLKTKLEYLFQLFPSRVMSPVLKQASTQVNQWNTPVSYHTVKFKIQKTSIESKCESHRRSTEEL